MHETEHQHVWRDRSIWEVYHYCYNPLAHSVFEYIRVPVQGDNYLVQDYRNVEIQHQMVSIPDPVKKLDFRDSNSTYELVFLAPELPPLGYKSFFIVSLKKETIQQTNTS